MRKLKVVELFAGVGGFRVGLEKTSKFNVVWSNQWEPSTVKQHASLVYENVFGGKNHSNEDIHTVKTSDIPDCDVLVGGFPCQDYSVATSLKNSKGLEGKKGVLWWQINRIIEEKTNKPSYIILENVDRLLKSPTNQRGRDFAIMLKCLDLQNYSVEWRVINSADYGFPQKRKRVFILGYHKSTNHYKLIKKEPLSWAQENGTLSSGFPIQNFTNETNFSLKGNDLITISKDFNSEKKLSPFKDAGIMIDGEVFTFSCKPTYNGPKSVLKDVLLNKKVDESF